PLRPRRPPRSPPFPYTTLFRSAGRPVLSAQNSEAARAEAIAELRKLGGRVEVDEARPDKPVIRVDLSRSEVADAELVHLRGLKRSEEHTSELQSRFDLVCRLLL